MSQRIQTFLVEKGSRWIFPLCFVFSDLVNVGFFYTGFGFADNPVREYGFILLNVLFALFCGFTLLAVLCTHRLSLKTWLLLSSVVIFYVVGYGIAFFRYGFSAPYYSGFLKNFIVFGLVSFFAGGCGAIMGREKSFFEMLDSLSWWVLPAALMYLNGSLTCGLPKEWNSGLGMGIFNYANIAYLCLPYVLIHTLGIVNGSPLRKPLSGETIKHPQLVRILLLLVFWGAILASGTRGVLLSASIGAILMVVFQLLLRDFRPASLVPLLLPGLLAFNLFVYAPSGFSRLGAFEVFLEGLSEGKIVTSRGDSSNLEENMDDLVAADIPSAVPNNYTESIPEDPVSTMCLLAAFSDSMRLFKTVSLAGMPVEVSHEVRFLGESTSDESPAANFKIANRGSIFKLAWKEFLKNPLTGMGPFGYEVKYNQYPHSVVMELLAETGLLGTVYLLGLIFFVVVKLAKASWENGDVRSIFLFVLVYAVLANSDAALWDCPALMFALGYGITYGDDKHAASKR